MSDLGETGALGIAGRLTRQFILSPLTPLFLMAAVAMGLIALMALPREEEPQISVPLVDVHVRADGLKAEDAVKLVTEPLENIIKGIDDVEHVYSQTRDNQVMVTARFKVGLSADTAILRLRDKLLANLDRIPVGIPQPLVVGRGINDVAIVTLTFAPAEGQERALSGADVSRIVHEVEKEITKIEDVGYTYIVGDEAEALRIDPDPERLALYGVTLQQLAGKIEGANRSAPAGLVRDNGEQVGLILGKTLESPEEIANLLLTTRDGRPVYVRDVAEVRFVRDLDEHHVATLRKEQDGEITRRPAVTLAIAKRAGANAVVVAQAIEEKLHRLEGSLIPESLEVEITRNYGETADEKANELLFHLGLATVSIVILIWLAIGWREAAVVAVVIPVTILITLFASWIMGYTINRVSLFALIFSIGILVDDAIVVIENIARHWAGKRREQSHFGAAVAAVAEVGNPTIVATLTVVVALLPMMFVSGLMGPYMSPIPANASAAMIFSFFIAVTITPWLMMKIAANAPVAHEEGGADGGRIGRIYAAFARPVLKTKARSLLFLLVVVVLSFGSLVALYTRDVTVKLLPFDNKSELSVVVDLPEGASVEMTDAILQQVARIALEMPEVISAQTYAGTAAPFDFNGLVRHYFLRQLPELGQVQINLLPKTERERTSHEIALDLRERLKSGITDLPEGTVMKTVEPPPGPPVIATLLAEVYGPDAQTRRETARRIREAFESVPFVVDVDDSFGRQPRQFRAELSPNDLEFFRVQERDVLDTLRMLNSQITVGYSHRGGGRQPIPIVVGRDRSEQVIDERMLATPVPANVLPGDRGVVELGDVVNIREEYASYPIFRHNGRYAEMVMGELAGQFEAPLYGMLAVAEKLDQMDWGKLERPVIRYHGQPQDESHTTLLWDGEWEVTWVTFRDMGAAFMVALLGIYILVVAQFGSFRLPLVILTPVPLTFLGIMFGHWLFGAPFSATSMIGFIALAGIIVRNSILLVDFIRHANDDGHVDIPTLVRAGATRFKPIFLTALAAMIGAAVILADPIFQGLAISLLFGLFTSTVFTVLVIPAIYRVFRT